MERLFILTANFAAERFGSRIAKRLTLVISSGLPILLGVGFNLWLGKHRGFCLPPADAALELLGHGRDDGRHQARGAKRCAEGNLRSGGVAFVRHGGGAASSLGHKASDIIQSNCVIWVEGPSDRIYLKHWIRSLDASLVEGVHYSIMFYGGRLLSHLSANDEEISDFIELRSLNRHLAIVIDSDRDAARGRLNDTKERIVREFKKDGGIAWVTSGREIENYIDYAELQRAVASVYGPAYGKPLSGGRFDHALYFKRSHPKRSKDSAKAGHLIEREVDKVKVARKVCDSEANLSVLDLRARVRELVELIKTANA